jgi:putative DNA modification/repair radical SAM protein
VDIEHKLRILADGAKYDASCASSGAKRGGVEGALGSADSGGICHSYTPDGRCVSLLRILLTNYCMYDCVYCVNRVSSDIPRARFTPAEVVNLTLEFYKRNYIEGLFLSSGIIQSPDYTMEQMVVVARSLREEHRFNGYIHLKAIPGASQLLIDEAARYADRMSANIELPTKQDLVQLAPEKKADVIEGTMAQIKTREEEFRAEAKREPERSLEPNLPAGQTTQMIVGATASTDRDIIERTSHLYSAHKLRRVYFTAFSPFPKADARLPLNKPDILREHRLYQADWLLRRYEFTADEITEGGIDYLDTERDPKLAWALRHREFFPVDVNQAPREALLRVPGIGHRNVQRILKIRRYHRLSLDDLAKLRVVKKRAEPFVITADHNPAVRLLEVPQLAADLVVSAQMNLFDAGTSALTGQL